MSLNLDPGTFGGTPACHILVERLNAAGDAKLARSLIRGFDAYFAGLNELIKMRGPRDTMINLWYKNALEIAEGLKDRLEEKNVTFSYVVNVLQYRAKRAKEHGEVIERMFEGTEDQLDWKKVLAHLNGRPS